MAHRIGGRKLGRKTGPRLALYRNLIVAVLRYEQVKTTEARAKEVRGQVERIITLAKEGTLASRRRIVAEHHRVPPKKSPTGAPARRSKQLKGRAGREQQKSPGAPASRPATTTVEPGTAA